MKKFIWEFVRDVVPVIIMMALADYLTDRYAEGDSLVLTATLLQLIMTYVIINLGVRCALIVYDAYKEEKERLGR